MRSGVPDPTPYLGLHIFYAYFVHILALPSAHIFAPVYYIWFVNYVGAQSAKINIDGISAYWSSFGLFFLHPAPICSAIFYLPRVPIGWCLLAIQ